MDSHKINRVEGQINDIRKLGEMFDRLASPNVEEETNCSLVCVLVSYSIMFLINSCTEETQSIIGDAELEVLHRLDKTLYDACYYHGEEKGFSKTQRWIDFVSFVNTVNALLKDAVQRYKATMEILKR